MHLPQGDRDAGVPKLVVARPSPAPFCRLKQQLTTSLAFEEMPGKRARKDLVPVVRGRLGGEKLSVMCDGALLYARIGHQWAVVPATHNRFDHTDGQLRFVATSHDGYLYGGFFHDNGQHIFRQSCFVIARNKDLSLRGENRSQDRATINWLQREFGIHTPNVLWPVARGTFSQIAALYSTFKEAQALDGCRLEPLAAAARAGTATVNVSRVTKAHCASGYPEEALVLSIGQRSIPVPLSDTYFSGWIDGSTIYIGREGSHLVVALYDLSNPTAPRLREQCSFLV